MDKNKNVLPVTDQELVSIQREYSVIKRFLRSVSATYVTSDKVTWRVPRYAYPKVTPVD